MTRSSTYRPRRTTNGAVAKTCPNARSARVPSRSSRGRQSCRIEVGDVDALYQELEREGVLHDVTQPGVTATDFGTREFATVDIDGNLLTFFRWERTPPLLYLQK